MDLFSSAPLPKYSTICLTVDYLSSSGKERWTFFHRYNPHRYYHSLDEIFDEFLQVCPEDYLQTIKVKFDIDYNYG